MKTLLQQFKTLFIGLTMMGALAVNAQDLDGDAPAGAQIEPVTITFTSSSTVKIQKWHSTHSPGDNVSVGGEVYDFSIRTITSTESVDLKANGYCDEFVVREGNVTHIQANGVDVVQGNNVMIEGTTYSSFTLPTSILQAQPWGREDDPKSDVSGSCLAKDLFLGPGAYQDLTLKANTYYDFTWTNHNTSKAEIQVLNGNGSDGSFPMTTNRNQWFSGTSDVTIRIWAVRNNCTWDGNGAKFTYKASAPTLGNTTANVATICPGEPVIVTAGTANTGVSGQNATIYYHGTTNNGSDMSNTATNNTVTAGGTYYYRARWNGCWSSSQGVTISTDGAPSADAGADKEITCGQEVKLDGIIGGDISQIQIGTTNSGKSENGYANGYYNYSYTRHLFRETEMAGSGLITSFDVYVENSPSNYTMQNQKIYIKNQGTSKTAFNSSYDAQNNGWQDPLAMGFDKSFEGSITFNGSGWLTITLNEPFYYTGTGSLELIWENRTGAWASGYPTFRYHSNWGYNCSVREFRDASFPTNNNWNKFENRYWIRFNKVGAAFSWSPSTGLSATNIPNPIASPLETTTYTLTATANGCTVTDQVTVTVNPFTTVNAGPGMVSDCNATAQLNGNVLKPYKVLFEEDFEGNGNYNLETSGSGWRYTSIGTNNSNAFKWHVWSNCANYEGSRGLGMYDSGNNCDYTWNREGNKIAWYGTKINASNYEDVVISFYWQAGGNDTDYGTLVYSLDGTNWTPVNSTKYNNQPTWQQVSNLDMSVVDGQEFYLGFQWQNNNASTGAAPGFSIDNIEVKGKEPVNFVWSPAASLNNANILNPTANPSVSTTYTLTATHSNGCQASDETAIVINKDNIIPKVPNPSATPDDFCVDEQVDLKALGMAPSGKAAKGDNTLSASINGPVHNTVFNNHTIEFWVKPDRTITLHDQINTGSHHDYTTDPTTIYSFAIHPHDGGTTSGGVGVSVGTNGVEVVQHGENYLPITLSYATNISDWTHIAVVHTNNTPTLYINGHRVKEGMPSTRPTYPSARIGHGYGHFSGLIDNVRVWNTSRTGTQIKDNMFFEVPTSTSGLLSNLPLNGNGTALTGSSGAVGGGISWVDPNHYTYEWTGGPLLPSASTDEIQSTTGVITTYGTYNYKVTAKPNVSCITGTPSDDVVVEARDTPIVGTVSAPDDVCDGENLSLTSPTINERNCQVTSSGWEIETTVGSGTFTTFNSPYTVTSADNGKKIRFFAECGCGKEYSNEVVIKVDEKPTLPTGISFDHNLTAQNCYGRTINMTAVGGTMSTGMTYTWTASNGTVTESGTYNEFASATPTQTTTYTLGVSANGACAAQPAVIQETYAFHDNSNVLATGGELRECYVSGNDTIHFYDPSNKRYIGSINPNGNKGLVTMNVNKTGSSSNVMYACDMPDNKNYWTAYMERSFVVNATTTGSYYYNNGTDYDVFFPYTHSELQDLETASNNDTPINLNDNVSVALAGSDIHGTKYPSSSNNTPQQYCTAGTDGEFITQAHHGMVNTGLSLNLTGTVYYVKFSQASFSDFKLHGPNMFEDNSPLPVELTSFSVNCQTDGAHISWSTATETNSDYFVVEFSRDGYNWEEIAIVDAAGSATTQNDYLVVDQSARKGYYRLVQTDYNGEFEVFGPISSSCDAQMNNLTVYPNPTSSSFTVEITATDDLGASSVVVTEATGRKVAQKEVDVKEGVNNVYFENTNFAPGTYIITIAGEDGKSFVPVKLVIR